MKNLLIKMVEEIIEEGENDFNIHIPYFIGGSRRFGWDITKSDIDVFIYIEDSMSSNFLSYLEGKYDFIQKNVDLYLEPSIQVVGLRGLMHLNIFTNKDAYSSLLKEHEKVDDLLNKEEFMITFIRILKKKGVISGAELYRTLTSMLVKEEKFCYIH